MAVVCFFASAVNAEDLSFTIQVVPESSRVIIEGECPSAKAFSFRDSYAGVLGLGGRIKELRVFDSAGAEAQVRKIAPGQYEATKASTRFQYEVHLTPPFIGSDAVKVSWLNSERGLLMLADVLPVLSESTTQVVVSGVIDSAKRKSGGMRARLRFLLPSGWSINSSLKQNPESDYEVTNLDHAVFVLGSRLRSSRATISGMSFDLIVEGDWAFTDNEAFDLAIRILKSHHDLFRSSPFRQAVLILLPFQNFAAGQWSGETRGSTVTLLMGRQLSKTLALAQLSTPLTHELFHLWVPNGLALEGDYDWFYEGFTVYQAARTAVLLDLLTFQEFLNAIARAYDAYNGAPDRARWSLIEASQRRWTVGQSAVYQKSMVIAFLYDLKLRNGSHSKQSLDDVYRELFRRYRSVESGDESIKLSARQTDGNETVIRILSGPPNMQIFTRTFIERPAVIDLPAELAPFGIHVDRVDPRTHLSVNEALTRRQRDLLRELGYNDRGHSQHRSDRQ